MYIYMELGLRVSEGSNASRKYLLESGKSPEMSRIPLHSPYRVFKAAHYISGHNYSKLESRIV
jgi:hypothetical protein